MTSKEWQQEMIDAARMILGLHSKRPDLLDACDDVVREVERLRATLEALEHPGGRPCPWCLTPEGFPHGQHCELAKALGNDKE